MRIKPLNWEYDDESGRSTETAFGEVSVYVSRGNLVVIWYCDNNTNNFPTVEKAKEHTQEMHETFIKQWLE